MAKVCRYCVNNRPSSTTGDTLACFIAPSGSCSACVGPINHNNEGDKAKKGRPEVKHKIDVHVDPLAVVDKCQRSVYTLYTNDDNPNPAF